MNISSAVFVCSAPDSTGYPDESLPEFAFIGRSNVGKSSLLNMLAGKQGLARVSPTPGFTKLINIFTINKTWRLVDLPGYGFAEGARKNRARFNTAVAEYLEHRTNLCLVFVLIEAGLAPQKIDLEFVKWLVRRDVPFVLVFAKSDKVSPAEVQANIATFTDRIAPWFVKLPSMLTCSAQAGLGRQELLGIIQEQITAIEFESSQAPREAESLEPSEGFRPEPAVRQKLKARPDLNRPW